MTPSAPTTEGDADAVDIDVEVNAALACTKYRALRVNKSCAACRLTNVPSPIIPKETIDDTAIVTVLAMLYPKITCTVSRGYTYSCIRLPPTDPTKPHVLFLHGWPSLPEDYHHQITHLSSLGYGIIAPELLGYGDTSHPVEADAYRLKLMAQDIVDILDQNAVPTVVAVGHDWGSTLLTRLEFYHPSRISKIVILAVGCAPFGQPFDVDKVNAMTKDKLGYQGFGYMVFNARDAEAPQIIDAHQDSFRSIVFSADPDVWKKHLAPVGALRKWLEEDQRTQETLQDFAQVRHAHEAAFSNEKGGYAATLNWYRNHVFQRNTPDEQAALQRMGGAETYTVEKPVLFLLAAKDPIAVAMIQRQMTEPYAPHMKAKDMDAGHWVMMEDVDNVNRELEDFFAA